MDWSQFVHELVKAYHFDSIYSSITNLRIGAPSKTTILLSCILFYPISKAIYNIYFHSLSRYPGPILAKATKIPVALVSLDGSLSQWMNELHNYYRSDIVRISPDELSFIGPSAWKDIYGLRPGHAEFPKDLTAFPGVQGILTANNADHRRYRRLLGHGFSEKALREQEPLIQKHIDNLINGLKKEIQVSNGKANMVDFFHWTTFDLISDLAFGESVDCLTNGHNHPWADMMVRGSKAMSLFHVTTRFPPLGRLLQLYVPKKHVQAQEYNQRLSIEKVQQRLKTETNRPDFVTYAMRHQDDENGGGMTVDELQENMRIFIGAGSDTTAASLAGAIWYLLANPHCLRQANEEVRGEFRRTEEINSRTVIERLPYLEAVINETFRIYPPILMSQPRLGPKGGDTVSGHWIPEGTQVKLNQYAANHSWLNFNSPETFAPSRWLGNEHFKTDKHEVLQPFGVGPRSCIGKSLALVEIRLVLTHLLWTFDMELAEETDEEWPKQKMWTTWEKKPLIVKLTERKV